LVDLIVLQKEGEPWCSGKVVALPFAEMQGKAVYMRPKVVRPCASGSYVHRASLLIVLQKVPFQL
jgi:hypothetical protein